MKLAATLASLLVTTFAAFGIGGCAEEPAEGEASSEEELVANTPRTVSFEGYVYVNALFDSASEELKVVRRQTESAFGPLRTANVTIHERRLQDVNARKFRTEELVVVSAKTGKPTGRKMIRVNYTFTGEVAVPKKLAKQTELSLALLGTNYEEGKDRIVEECTGKSELDRQMKSDLWWVFNPSLDTCKAAIETERAAIEKVTPEKGTVTDAEVARLYQPVTMTFSAP